MEQEQTQAIGGHLDILAAAADTSYSIEVQLGEVDASHGFRVFDFWAATPELKVTYAEFAAVRAPRAQVVAVATESIPIRGVRPRHATR